MIASLFSTLVASSVARTALRHGATALAILLFLLFLRRAGEPAGRRQLAILPILTIRPGFPVRVLVTQDIVLEPWRG